MSGEFHRDSWIDNSGMHGDPMARTIRDPTMIQSDCCTQLKYRHAPPSEMRHVWTAGGLALVAI